MAGTAEMGRMVPQRGGMRKVRRNNCASDLGKPEIQASHLKRMIEDGESCLKIGQQASRLARCARRWTATTYA